MELDPASNGDNGKGRRNFFQFKGFPGRVKSSRGIGETPRASIHAGNDQDLRERETFLNHPSTDETSASYDMDLDRNDSKNRMESISYTDSSRVHSAKIVDNVAEKLDSIDETVSVSAYRSMSAPRTEKFQKILDEQIVDLEILRELAWSGIPPLLRPLCWRLLLGYVPPNKELRGQVLGRKRKEYKNLVSDYYNDVASNQDKLSASGSSHAHDEESALRQVVMDVPRTAPEVSFFHQCRIQKSLERILFIWGIRHPASGYVQGINDLATPFLAIFTSERMQEPAMEQWNVELLSDEDMLEVEADSYWCLCKLLDGIQDHYTYAQPGIQKTLFHVGELISRVEGSVAEHLASEGVQYMQFAFRWVNCLLLREIPFHLGIRLWDTYLSEGSALKGFLVYVLSSFLLCWAPELKDMDFQEIIMFLQHCPTSQWTERDIELVLSRAFMWRTSFKDASSHFS